MRQRLFVAATLLGLALAGCGGSSSTLLTRAGEFKVCVSRSPVLSVPKHRAANGLEQVTDRAHGEILAEFGFLPSAQASKTLSNSLQFRSTKFKLRDGRYVLLATPAADAPALKHDVTAIEHCTQQAFQFGFST
jgi:hypothetical protein